MTLTEKDLIFDVDADGSVEIMHVPTGIVSGCSEFATEKENREKALCVLKSAVEVM